MKLIVLIALVSAVCARPDKLEQKPIEIISSFSEGDSNNFKYGFKSADGVNREEEVAQKQIGEEAGATARGSYSYTDPEGKVITVTYVADENGFQPQGAHLPVAPQPSPAILRALEQIRRTNEADAKRAMMAAAAARA